MPIVGPQREDQFWIDSLPQQAALFGLGPARVFTPDRFLEHGETAMVGELEVELAQGHGAVEAGKECHLVVKLPYSDDGASVVRAWIGGEDRTFSLVGLAEYAPSHDDYDVHAVAPDPLPEGALWWIELEQPDGTKLVGSATPQF